MRQLAGICPALLLGTSLLFGSAYSADANTLTFTFSDDGTNSTITPSGTMDVSDFTRRAGTTESGASRVMINETEHNEDTGQFWEISASSSLRQRGFTLPNLTVSGASTFTGSNNSIVIGDSYSSGFYFWLSSVQTSLTMYVSNPDVDDVDKLDFGNKKAEFDGTLATVLGDNDFRIEFQFGGKTVIFATTPTKPVGIAAVPGIRQVTLNWTDPNIGSITKYQFQQKSGDGGYGNWTDIDPSGAATTSHIITGLSNGTEYTFRIRAVNPAGNSVESDEVSATPDPLPAKPVDLEAIPGDGQVILNWANPGNSSITKYQFQQKAGSGNYGNWTDIEPSSAATTSHTISGLSNGTEYTFRIRAVNPTGSGGESDEVSATPGVPLAAELEAMPGTEQVSLSWTISEDTSITKWQYQQREGDADFGDEWKDIPDSGAATRNYTVDELTGDIDYSFRVRAVNAHGDGILSNESQATPAKLGAPAAAELTASLEDGQAILSWTLADDPSITKWQFQQREGDEAFGTSWEDIPDSGATTRDHAIAKLTAGVTHGFRVRAVNAAGNGLRSNEATVTLPAGGPSLEEERQVVEQTLAAVGQATLAGVTDVIDERLKSTPGPSTLMLGGQTVTGTASSRGSQDNQKAGGWWSGNRVSEAGYRPVDDAGMLDGSAFTLSLSEEDTSARNSGWTIWGRGDYQSFEGKTGEDSWDGSVKSAWLGIDTRVNDRMLAGFAVSRNRGEINLVTEAVGSRVETSLTGAWPYMQMTMPSGTGTVRVILGVGSGDAEHHSEDGDVERASLSMTAASVGARWDMSQQGAVTLTVPVKAEVVQLKTDGDGTTPIGGLSVRTWQVSGGVEAIHSGVALSDSGWVLTPRGSLTFRWDGGDGVTGKGIEVGGGFGLHAPDSRVSLDASGHWLATHSDDNQREWGASIGVQIAPDSRGHGWSASLRQEWGLQQAGVLSDNTLFQNGASGAVPAPGTLAARAGYGFGVIEGLMTVSADARLATGDEEVPHYGAGLEFALPRGLTATLRGEHVDAVDPDTRIGAGVQLRF